MSKYQVIKEIKVLDFVALREGMEIELNEGEPLKLETPYGLLELQFESQLSLIIIFSPSI